MSDITFEQSVLIKAPVEAVFAFCSSRAGFERHFPHPLRWESGPEQWRQHSELAFQFRYLRWWVHYRTRLTQWEPQRRFVDEMVAGPYRRFVHTHSFEPVGGGTLYTDHVAFSTGFGRWIDRTVALRQIRATFKQRHARMKHALESGPLPLAARRAPTGD